ncbi:MAG: tRNA (adenosine(37)-N6)-threonylcarbamoyltransferase complex dimerization subunit type 1 TsaB [Bacteroidales bacterium]
MPVILHIETSTRVCSVGVSVQGELVAYKEDNSQNYSHSSVLTPFIEDTLRQAAIPIRKLSTVAISMGPGSYTGLRIGVSTAKGICYALDIPLIAIDTLHAMASHGVELLKQDDHHRPLLHEHTIFCPMIDARRMEVYYNLFDHQMNALRRTEARIIDQDTFNDLEQNKTLILMGDGSQKCQEVIGRSNIHVMPWILPSVKGMVGLAQKKYDQKDFVDVAYFEPFYLKDFVAGKPKVKGLYR